MSKESFSNKVSEIMYKKTHAIDNIDLKTLFEKEENFEIAICIAYMSLSKEKIIDKELKNKDRLKRLTQHVETSEIDKVFKPNFATKMPNIIYAKENNNLWILDNIRDSIMHGVCDIDEERRLILINNNQFDRELIAEIPFEWFIAYAKNDILSKKILNKYTIRNFYYNKNKKEQEHLDTHKELYNNIIYRVNIDGNNFNIKEIENRINELFLIYSKETVDNQNKEKYKTLIDKNKKQYNENYLLSFYISCEKVKQTINKEYPNLNIDIYLDNKKHNFINKQTKNLPKYFISYDLMYKTFNDRLKRKGNSLLNVISNIIENINTNQITKENETQNLKEQCQLLHKILTDEEIETLETQNISYILSQDLKTLRTIYLNIYGLSTLVINHENLYNQHFINQNPIDLGLRVHIKKTYLDYAKKRKTLIMKLLETQITLSEKREQYNNCNNDNAKKLLLTTINDLKLKLETINKDLNSLSMDMSFEQIIKTNEINEKEKERIDTIINKYYNHLNSTNNIKIKRKIKKIISKLLELQIQEESKYIYGYCTNMNDALTIIRNSFSHIGRVYVGKNQGAETVIILNDYDTNGEKTGEVICNYNNLIELLNSPYTKEKNKNTF